MEHRREHPVYNNRWCQVRVFTDKMQRGVKLANSLVLTCQSVNWDDSSEIRTSLLTPIKVGDKLFNLPIIALIAHFF